MEYELFEQFCSKDNRNCACIFDDYGDLEEANPTCPVRGNKRINCVAFSPDGKILILQLAMVIMKPAVFGFTIP
jgi:hypothetical protein